MKRLIQLSMAVTLVAVMACNAWATTGDNIFFSTTNSLGASLTAANITPTFAAGQGTLYIWVSSVSGDDITPPDTGITPVTISGTTNYIPNSQASLAANFTITSGTSANFSGNAANGVQFYQGSFTGGTAGIGTGTDLNGLDRTKVWDSASNFTYGLSGTANVTATAVTNATVSVVPTTTSLGAATGVSRGFALTQANAGAGTNAQKSTGTANTFLLGQVNFTAVAGTDAVLQIQSSTLGIFRGGDGTGTVTDPGNKTSAYNYFNATIHVGAATRNGDVTGATLNTAPNGVIDAQDINQIALDIRNGETFATKPADDTNGDHIVNIADYNHEVGSLADTALGTGTGTHPGDANLSGVVNFTDFQILQNNFGGTGKGFDTGDFNGDGNTNFTDFQILQNNFGQSGGNGAFAAVPEPATFVLAGMSVLGLLAIRRKVA